MNMQSLKHGELLGKLCAKLPRV